MEKTAFLKSISEILKPVEGELSPLPDGLGFQIGNFIFSLYQLNITRGQKARTDALRELALVYFKLWQFVYSRDVRVRDIASPEVQEAIKKKKQLFPYDIPRLVLCVDGRVLSKLFAGLHGNAVRVPAGEIDDFVPGEDGNLFLSNFNGSYFATMLEKVFGSQDTLVEVFDSHVGCAARAQMAAKVKYQELADKGLADDVRLKSETVQALRRYVAEEFKHRGKKIIPIQTSFDPRSGYCYMALETCLEDVRVKKEGFTDDILKILAEEQKIIFSKDLIDDDFFKDLFLNKYFFEINYETEYRRSTAQFWNNITSMSVQALPVLEERLRAIFERDAYFVSLDAADQIGEIKERALLLLANTYNAFLHQYDGAGKKREYPYGEHDESVIAVTFSEKGPFDRARAFSVNPNFKNPASISQNIDFMDGLIRNNRKAGRMSKTERTAVAAVYPESTEYIKNPIPVLFFERLKHEQVPSNEVLERLQRTDWSDLSQINWMQMSSFEFASYLFSKVPSLPLPVAELINSMRKKAVEIMKPGFFATPGFLNGSLVGIWVLTGPDRKTIALFPFAVKGFHQEK